MFINLRKPVGRFLKKGFYSPLLFQRVEILAAQTQIVHVFFSGDFCTFNKKFSIYNTSFLNKRFSLVQSQKFALHASFNNKLFVKEISIGEFRIPFNRYISNQISFSISVSEDGKISIGEHTEEE